MVDDHRMNRRGLGHKSHRSGKIGFWLVIGICTLVLAIFVTSTGRIPNLDLVLLTILLSMEIRWRLLYILDMD